MRVTDKDDEDGLNYDLGKDEAVEEDVLDGEGGASADTGDAGADKKEGAAAGGSSDSKKDAKDAKE